MKLFGRKSAGRAAVRPVLAHGLGTVMLGEWPRSYEAQVREGYAGNAVAQRAVRLVAEGVASVPLAASDDAARVLVTATSGGQALLETLAIHLLLHGNGYVQLICDARGAPVELFALRPERVRVESDARGWPVAYLYRVGEAALRIPADEMVHIRSHHPLDDHYGLGCLDAASGPIAIHNAATKWNKALLDNAARPSGALVYAPGGDAGLSSEQFDRLKTELSESYSGALNAGRPMLLEGGLSWQAMSLSPADMDFIALKANAAREIALAFGVPPMLLGLPGDATYANYREANKALWRQTILPLAGKMLDAIAQALRPHFDGLTLAVDPDQVPALSEDRERLWAQVSAADFLTLAEKRALVGLAALPVNDNDTAPAPATPGVEMKFNPWHDPRNGQFTFGPGGANFGGGGATSDWTVDPPKRRAPPPAPPGAMPKPPLRIRRADTGNGRARKVPSQTTVGSIAQQPRAGARRVKSNGYLFEIDRNDRTVRASGALRIDPSQLRSKPNQLAAGKPDRLTTDHGGHYIAREFGGPTEKFNHFAQDASFNKSEYRKVEIHWRNLVEKGYRVDVDIVPAYDGQSQRPAKINVRYSDGKNQFRVTFPNAGKGK